MRCTEDVSSGQLSVSAFTALYTSRQGHLTSIVWIAPPGRTYPGLLSPPCSSNTQSTRGGTCALRLPGNPKTDRLTFYSFPPPDKEVKSRLEAAVPLCCVLQHRDARPAVSAHRAATSASPPSVYPAMKSPVSTGLQLLISFSSESLLLFLPCEMTSCITCCPSAGTETGQLSKELTINTYLCR